MGLEIIVINSNDLKIKQKIDCLVYKFEYIPCRIITRTYFNSNV